MFLKLKICCVRPRHRLLSFVSTWIDIAGETSLATHGSTAYSTLESSVEYLNVQNLLSWFAGRKVVCLIYLVCMSYIGHLYFLYKCVRFFPCFHIVIRPSNREFVMNDLWHYLFQKTDCAIRREVDHRVIVSCFGQRNMIYKFVINI